MPSDSGTAGLDIALKVSRLYRAWVERRWGRRVMAETLGMEGVVAAEVGLVITSDRRIRKINRDYRKIDAPTDVIAFALTEQVGSVFVSPPDGTLHLGEVVISYPRAVAQAEERGHSISREMAILIVHGLLHLLGYDHVKASEGRRMRAKEAAVLNRLEGLQLC